MLLIIAYTEVKFGQRMETQWSWAWRLCLELKQDLQ